MSIVQAPNGILELRPTGHYARSHAMMRLLASQFDFREHPCFWTHRRITMIGNSKYFLASRPLRILEGNDFRLAVWVVKSWSGSPANRAAGEHDAIAWLKAMDLEGLPLAHPLYAELLRDLLAPLDHKAQARL
jgi:hypothetical protein